MKTLPANSELQPNYSGLLQKETGLLSRLCDELLKKDNYKTEKARAYERRAFSVPGKYLKSQLPPGLRESQNSLELTLTESIMTLWFDPVTGRYRAHIKGNGEQMYEVLAELVGIDDSSWGVMRSVVNEGYQRWRDY